MHPEHRSIGELAYHLWQARGCPEGSAERDWLDAEKQLQSALRAAEPRTAQPAASPGQGTDEPPPKREAKRKAARAPNTDSAAHAPPRARGRSKSIQGKPSPEAPG